MNSSGLRADPRVFLGLFIISLSTLMYEILLTRIFSVTTWYHFAFLTISIALLGLTIGGIYVYMKPGTFVREKTHEHMSLSALSFSLLSVGSVLIHIFIPFLFGSLDPQSVIPLSLFAAIPFLLATFVSGGICVALCLTRFGSQVNKLYAADLIGAATGCLLIVGTMQVLDAITETFLIGLLSALAALCFRQCQSPVPKPTVAICLLFATIFSLNGYCAHEQKPLLRLFWSKGERESSVLYEKWNSFSRIKVYGDPDAPAARPLGYELSKTLPENLKVRSLCLDIDGSANTSLFQDDGSLKSGEHLRYELPYLVHYLRPDAKVLVIGVGGGRDILAAVSMKQQSCTGVEINGDILNVLKNIFTDWTGRLASNPRVRLVNDEARSWVTRSPNQFDIIQASLIDTWAAGSSGAFALTENTLYTTEAWESFLNHLTDRGILTMSRWYRGDSPLEMYRLARLAAQALKGIGIKDPQNHIIIARQIHSEFSEKLHLTDGMGDILVSKQPFSSRDDQLAKTICDRMGFDIVYSPQSGVNNSLSPAAREAFFEAVHGIQGGDTTFDTSAPNDDRPFFFQLLRPDHFLDPRSYENTGAVASVISGSMLLITALATVFLSFYCFRFPYLHCQDKTLLQGTAPYFSYFLAIGLGFMFIEIAIINRLNMFLGHPIYAISITLFSLLLSTGLGSFLLQFFSQSDDATTNRKLFATILIVLIGMAIIISPVTHNLAGANTIVRSLATIAILFPIGLTLGISFPLGMKLALRKHESLAPWLWGINGAGSVCGSVMGTVICMFAGINFCYAIGVICYLGALIAMTKMSEVRSSGDTR